MITPPEVVQLIYVKYFSPLDNKHSSALRGHRKAEGQVGLFHTHKDT